MEIILSKQCKSLTGSLGRGFGYHIQRRKNGFFAIRSSKGIVPPGGHWRFIVTCAELAKNGLHITDVKVSGEEVEAALVEAGLLHRTPYRLESWKKYNAADVLSLKERSGL